VVSPFESEKGMQIYRRSGCRALPVVHKVHTPFKACKSVRLHVLPRGTMDGNTRRAPEVSQSSPLPRMSSMGWSVLARMLLGKTHRAQCDAWLNMMIL